MEKAYFIGRKSGPAMVRPASSDFWKAPLVLLLWLVYRFPICCKNQRGEQST